MTVQQDAWIVRNLRILREIAKHYLVNGQGN
jgi:hypothetical protein